MFFSSMTDVGCRKVDALDRPDDLSRWIVVPVVPGEIALYFALLNSDTGPFGMIISALTQSSVVHVETRIDVETSDEWQFAESRLGLKYDFEGALRAWNDSGYHTQGKEFCSGLAYEILNPIIPGLQAYPCPGRLLMQVASILGMTMPKMSAPAEVSEDDLDWLMNLPTDQVATGTKQEIMAVLA